jgi:hypothetical protein
MCARGRARFRSCGLWHLNTALSTRTKARWKLSHPVHPRTRRPKPRPPIRNGRGSPRNWLVPKGFSAKAPGHSFLFIPRSPDTLVVTFDNLDIAMNKRAERRPWGFEFIEKQGWSMLGVMANGWTWYRDPWVWAEFDRLRADGFFARFGAWCSMAPRWAAMRRRRFPAPVRGRMWWQFRRNPPWTNPWCLGKPATRWRGARIFPALTAMPRRCRARAACHDPV